LAGNAAFIYDTPAGAETAIQLLQYANSQLLEFRHYDDLLTHELEGVYDFLDKGIGLWSRWRTANAATKLHTVLLDGRRTDGAGRTMPSSFSATCFPPACTSWQRPGWASGLIKISCSKKLNTAEELYHFMVDQFNQSRALRARVDGGHHSDHRADLGLPRQTPLALDDFLRPPSQTAIALLK